ncbi:hypothetical protein [Mucilaginibacter flavidus]|uniref:hypothetical protein n=1 Tax=Mucilaginibacter flavidus TaxID=2949309 RepID=UPI002093B211|nr:hypothetical protein [Mucilaginibacter flavidus]MCO5949118.1 hypothetical protein [Mucilaginibacter flavidus]
MDKAPKQHPSQQAKKPAKKPNRKPKSQDLSRAGDHNLTKHDSATMEVHHHPQLEHKPKPWKEYLLEYIMIVLAVTTGFFAESLREYLGDHGKETEYVASLKNDLRQDTANVALQIKNIKIQVVMMDSLIMLVNKPVLTPDEVNAAYYYARSGLPGNLILK